MHTGIRAPCAALWTHLARDATGVSVGGGLGRRRGGVAGQVTGRVGAALLQLQELGRLPLLEHQPVDRLKRGDEHVRLQVGPPLAPAVHARSAAMISD